MRREEKRREEKSILFTEFIGLIGLGMLTLACDDRSTQTTISSQTYAIVDDEPLQNSEVVGSLEADEEHDEDAADPTIEISWIAEDADKTPVEDDVLVLKIKNHLEGVAQVRVEVVFGGLLTETEKIELGTVEIGGTQEVYLEVPAEDIPLQTTKCVCAAVAFATATYVNNGMAWNDSAATDHLYYQYQSDYKGLRFFKEQVFLAQFGGEFVNIDNFDVTRNDLEGVAGLELGQKLSDRERRIYEKVTIPEDAPGEPRVIGSGIGSIPLAVLDAQAAEINARREEVAHE